MYQHNLVESKCDLVNLSKYCLYDQSSVVLGINNCYDHSDQIYVFFITVGGHGWVLVRAL